MFSNTYVFIHVHVYHVSNLFTYWYLIREKYDFIQMRLLNGSHECNNRKGQGRGTCTKGEYELETALWFYPIQDRQPFRITPTSHRRGYFPYIIIPLQCACTFDLSLNSRGYHNVGLSPLTFLFLDEYFCWLSFWGFHEVCCCYTKIYVVRGRGKLS